MNERESDELADRLARVFHLWLQRHYPDYVWVRTHRKRQINAQAPGDASTPAPVLNHGARRK